MAGSLPAAADAEWRGSVIEQPLDLPGSALRANRKQTSGDKSAVPPIARAAAALRDPDRLQNIVLAGLKAKT